MSAGDPAALARGQRRAVPGFDAGTGALVAVTLTDRPDRQGAGIAVLEPRPDLDEAVPPPRGWHWSAGRGELVCELAPTAEDVLAQVAEDLARGDTAGYGFAADDPPAERLREVARDRMALPAAEAEHWCALLLRRTEAHLCREARKGEREG